MKSTTRALARFLYRRTLSPGAKSALRHWLALEEPDRPPMAIENFTESRVLVLAPHMDDETIGCGGTIRRHVLGGGRVAVAFLTDGRKGNRELRGEGDAGTSLPRDVAQRVLEKTRIEEARRAAAILGIAELFFLGGEDGALEASAAMVERVTALLAKERPEVVYVPSMLDLHSDHWAANCILDRAALALDVAERTWTCREFEVWTPLFPNRAVDIGDVVDAKRQALEQYVSQLATTDYVRTTLGLNTYRSIYLSGGRGYAEALFESAPEEFARLHQRLRKRQ